MSECDKYQEMISQMLDGELPEPHKTELVKHLGCCPDCRRVYDAFSAISLSLGETAAPEGFAGEIGHIQVDPQGPECGCGTHGCLERFAGRRSILAAAGLPHGVSVAGHLGHSLPPDAPRRLAESLSRHFIQDADLKAFYREGFSPCGRTTCPAV